MREVAHEVAAVAEGQQRIEALVSGSASEFALGWECRCEWV